jgi:hypothetical protein
VTTLRLPGHEVLVLVQNRSRQSVGGPLYLELTGLPANVRLLTRHGTTTAHRPKGSPYLIERVLPGGSAGFLLQFSGNANFGVRVLEGAGAV